MGRPKFTPEQRKQHSDNVRKAWAEGKYSSRDTTYRSDPGYRLRIAATVRRKWIEGTYTQDRNRKISRAHKGKLKPKRPPKT